MQNVGFILKSVSDWTDAGTTPRKVYGETAGDTGVQTYKLTSQLFTPKTLSSRGRLVLSSTQVTQRPEKSVMVSHPHSHQDRT